MKWKKTLAFIMVFIFMMSTANVPVSASINSEKLKMLSAKR